ncbi:TlpA family protein disulfide reductase [Haloflavibacter putidus]|uniref:TlpA family protein disulfide reductase n=1 Tax=Haloflavibacter putidus TaxID=2576776 RepID=A0A507ZNN9_9FLAO|nr:TlpA family protein disulfide reductase [Haloflavibacter putidus]TQD39150.1 TlpA family protein disulfide reductase [Haloflavibacter putidus]
MVRFLLLFLITLYSFSTFAQQEKLLFSQALDMYLPKYKSNVKEAYRLKHDEKARFLFDSLVKNCLIGTYMDDFKVRDISKDKETLYQYQKPIFLITYASWCVTDKGEVPALNQLAREYGEDVQFVVLFWDKRSEALDAASKYSGYIDVLYVNELSNKHDFVVKNLKHALGFPTVYQIGSDKQIIDIQRLKKLPFPASFEDSFNLNYATISSGVSNIVAHEKELLSTVEFAITD